MSKGFAVARRALRAELLGDKARAKFQKAFPIRGDAVAAIPRLFRLASRCVADILAAMKFLELAGFCFGCVLVQAADPFAEGVRPTDPLPATEQQKTFKAPPGFEVQLIASEPDIQKPMNMAFDAQGRLWVTDSREYPYAAPLDKPARDTIKILEDFDASGRARKITTFADNLNIPIGLYPYKNGVIAWSIPNIWYFQDTDGDGKADKRDVLFGPLGWERDTHGNQASFRRGFDGWLYITHGYNNQSTITGRDGSSLTIQSGNTYRVRLDGSRVEPHAFGQVNPFGLCFDPMGNIYSADCHSSPVYELLRGAYYPSFGKPHDGLGFGPTMIEHSHGSTAISGIVFYADDQWPAEFQNNVFIGNVMTSRVNRDTLLPRGSSKTAREEADFLTTTDPWFRPVDLQLGPDGALYIADFYNKIIGHYEVPLTHPGRDRERGRLWRVVYKSQQNPDALRVDKGSVEGLVAEFSSPNLTRRMLALNALLDRAPEQSAPALARLLAQAEALPAAKANALWAVHRLGKLTVEQLRASARHGSPLLRAHAMRVLSEAAQWDATLREIALPGLDDPDATVARCAADALGQHPDAAHVAPLLALRKRVPAADDHLLHTVRMALRNQLRDPKVFAEVRSQTFPAADLGYFADLVLSIQSSEAALFLQSYLPQSNENPDRIAEYVRHAARYLPAEQGSELTKFIRSRFASEPDRQLTFFNAIEQGNAQRGASLSAEVKTWGTELASKLVESVAQFDQTWVNYQVPGKETANPWFLQKRVSADGNQNATFVSSLPPGGEHLTGHLRSQTFKAPAKISFYLAGHDGIPSEPAKKQNRLEVREARSQAVLATVPPPRNDLAQRFELDLGAHQGKEVYLELIDEDTGSGYAWLALGRLEPELAPLPSTSPNAAAEKIKAAADLASKLQAKGLQPQLGRLVAAPQMEADARASVARALASLDPSPTRNSLAAIVGEPALPAAVRINAARAMTAAPSESQPALSNALRAASATVQTKVAQSLAGSAEGAQLLVQLVERGEVTPRVFLDAGVKDKLTAYREAPFQTRIQQITATLTPADAAAQKLIDQHKKEYAAAKADPLKGGQVFAKSCAICHQIDGIGAVVGPQLDGIGGRGLERILEDILDPNRNVDLNFRTHVIATKDGEVYSGLPRREEGATLVLADSTAKEIRIQKSQIEKRRESETSLMPANFGEVLTRDELHDLLAYLMSKGGGVAAPGGHE